MVKRSDAEEAAEAVKKLLDGLTAEARESLGSASKRIAAEVADDRAVRAALVAYWHDIYLFSKAMTEVLIPYAKPGGTLAGMEAFLAKRGSKCP